MCYGLVTAEGLAGVVLQKQDLARSVELAEILCAGSDDRESVMEHLRKWAYAWAMTLGARVWRMGNSSKLVLTGVRMLQGLLLNSLGL